MKKEILILILIVFIPAVLCFAANDQIIQESVRCEFFVAGGNQDSIHYCKSDKGDTCSGAGGCELIVRGYPNEKVYITADEECGNAMAAFVIGEDNKSVVLNCAYPQEKESIIWQDRGDVPGDGFSVWNKESNIYYNPRIVFEGKAAATYHDDETATEWCRRLNKGYTKGTSVLQGANPIGDRLAWHGGEWVNRENSDYARKYICAR
ncbi:MAG: hypothetical protein PHP89_05200 [Candidatus Omnitrophica bacterium]|jgi:hypothetical protein|nr:hypothetical protein [Candidatus Omnitrophota bacterium]